MNYFERLVTFARTVRSTMLDISDRLISLHSDLQDNTKAIAEANKTANKNENIPVKVLTESRFPEGIEIHKSTPDAADDRKHQRYTLFVLWCTFFAVFGYAVLVFFQLREMINATDVSAQAVNEARQNRLQAEKFFRITVEQSHLDQRAWVGAKAMSLNFPLAAEKQIVGTILVGNSGKTFALKATAKVWIHISTTAMNQLPHPNAKDISPVVLFPNQELSLKAAFPTTPKEGDVTALKNKTLFLYLYGKISYVDVFGKQHQTDICGIFTGDNDFNACSFHNYAD